MQVNDENRSEPKEFKQKLYFHSKDRNQLYYIFLKKSPSKQASQVLLIGLEGGGGRERETYGSLKNV